MGGPLQEKKKTPPPPRKGLEFAERQLKRHGWSKGKGLGKLENGISEALRVKVKCDTAGVGHNSAEQFTFHWWDHLFNSSAASIAVEAGQDGVKVKSVSEQDGAITNKKPRKCRGDKKMLYGRFVKAATLTAGGEEPLQPLSSSSDSSEEDEEEKLDLSSARRLTDEALLRACGGRTAHKGARHGFTMSAKLARLEEQEKAFLASGSQLEASCRGPDAKRKKAKRRKRSKPEAVALGGLGVAHEDEEPQKGRRKRRKWQDGQRGHEEQQTASSSPRSQKRPQ